MEGHYALSDTGIASLVNALSAPTVKRFQVARDKYRITQREYEIILVTISGYSNIEIASHFSLSAHTVKHHMTHIFDKLGVSNRLELALFAVNHQIVPTQ